MKQLWVVFLFVILLVPGVQGLSLTDNMYFTLEPNTTRCVDIMIPDDLGYASNYKVDYEIDSTAQRGWSDLTDKNIISTDENNTVRFPVCFYGLNKKEGDCSEPFKIIISAPELEKSREFNLGLCIAGNFDVDIEELDDGETVEDVVNTNVDFFDLGFEDDMIYMSAGEERTVKLLVESYADLRIDIESNGLNINPASTSVLTSETDPLKELSFTLRAPDYNGEFEITVDGHIYGCEEALCSKTARLIAIVGEDPPQFTLSIFPKTLNIKDPRAVLYSIVIENNGDAGEFQTGLSLPSGLTSNFEPQSITMDSGSKETINFVISPQAGESSYEIKATVVSNGVLKEDFSHLSVNEMQTDLLRASDGSEDVENWLQEYENSSYGADLDTYRRLQDRLQGSNTTPVDNNTIPPEEPEPVDYTWIVIPAVAVVVIVILLILFMSRKKKPDEFIPLEADRIRPVRTLHPLHPCCLRLSACF